MGALADALVQRGGYNMQDALNAENGPRASQLAKEFGVGGAGGGGGGLQDINSMIESAFTKLQTDLVNNYKSYKASNPWSLDEILSQKTLEAQEQIDPYYNETLSNYLTGVTNRIERGQTDARTLLTELDADVDSYTSGNKIKLDQALSKANQGYADSGLFDSGDRMRNEGVLQAGANIDQGNYLRGAASKRNSINTGLNRTLTDIGLESTQQQRDIERSRFTDVSQRANELTGEAGQQYIQGFRATLPAELQAISGFDALKDLGIYS